MHTFTILITMHLCTCTVVLPVSNHFDVSLRKRITWVKLKICFVAYQIIIICFEDQCHENLENMIEHGDNRSLPLSFFLISNSFSSIASATSIVADVIKQRADRILQSECQVKHNTHYVCLFVIFCLVFGLFRSSFVCLFV